MKTNSTDIVGVNRGAPLHAQKKTLCSVFFSFLFVPGQEIFFLTALFAKFEWFYQKRHEKQGPPFWLAASETCLSVTHNFKNKIIKTTPVRTI